MSEALEHEIQADILEYLFSKGCLVLRANNIVRQGIRSLRIYGQTEQRGICDIIGCTPSGKFFAVEVKKHDGKTTEYQDAFITLVRSKKGIAFSARSIEDVKTRIEKFL